MVILLPISAHAEVSPKQVKDALPEQLLGIWKQADDGRYLQITQDACAFYDYTKTLCYRVTPDSGKPLSEIYKLFDVSDNDRQLSLWKEDYGTRFERFYRDEFVRVQSLPKDSIEDPDKDPRFKEPPFIATLICQQFDEHFPFFAQRRFDWPARKQAFLQKVHQQTPNEVLFEGLCAMLQGLGDSHTRIYWTERKAPFKSGRTTVLDALEKAFAQQNKHETPGEFNWHWSKDTKAKVDALLVEPPMKLAAQDRFRWGILKGNVGYIENDGLYGFSPKGTPRPEELTILGHELDSILAALKDCKALILDLSYNVGGYDPAALAIAGRFADQRRHVMSYHAAGQSGDAKRKCFVRPAGPYQYTKPVYVITTNSTVSAAEALVLALKAFPHITHVGEPTRGCLSSFLNKWMPNDFHLTLSNQIWEMPNGTVPEGVGIRPHKRFPVFAEDDLFGSHFKALEKTLDLIKETVRTN